MIPPLDFIPDWLQKLWVDESIEQSFQATHGYFLETNVDRLPEIEACYF